MERNSEVDVKTFYGDDYPWATLVDGHVNKYEFAKSVLSNKQANELVSAEFDNYGNHGTLELFVADCTHYLYMREHTDDEVKTMGQDESVDWYDWCDKNHPNAIPVTAFPYKPY